MRSRSVSGIALAAHLPRAFPPPCLNICARPTRAASELTRAEFIRGRAQLARLIARLEPEVVAFVGITVYRAFFGPGVAQGRVEAGAHRHGARVRRASSLGPSTLPNPSGLNAAYPGFEDKLVWFRRLKRYAER
jgi:TDG/mug DNA glycosylase family protein